MSSSTERSRGRGRVAALEPLRPQEREEFARELVAFQIEELNGLGDRIAFLSRRRRPDKAALQEAWQRCQNLVEALRWNADEVVRATWAFLEKPLEAPEDLFGPALLLRSFCPNDPRVPAILKAAEKLPFWFLTMN